jgi:branched-subunit amino acid ABC-type transport system permease component
VSLFVQSIGFGLVTASILAMGAVGFTLQFGVTNLFNLAFGESLTVAAFCAYLTRVSLHWNMWLAMAAGGLAGHGVLARGQPPDLPAVPEARHRPVRDGHHHRRGVDHRQEHRQHLLRLKLLQLPAPPERPVHILGMVFAPRELIIMGLAAASMLGLHLLFRYTRIGKAMRATSDDGELARSVGIPTARVISVAWLLSGLLAGLAGVALAMDLGTFDANTGGSFLLIIVAAAVFGSVGEPYGAMIGALVIGIASEITAIYDPGMKDVVAFGILVLVLLWRPAGLRAGQVQMRAEVVALCRSTSPPCASTSASTASPAGA